MKSFTESQRGLLKVNVLYAIVVWGMMLMGFIMGFLMVFGINPMAEPYGAGFSIYMVIAEALPVLLPGIILLMLPAGRGMISSMRLKFRPSALLAIPAGVAGYLLVLGISALWMSLLSAIGLGQESGLPVPDGGAQLGASILVIALWPALCEEFFFRGLMLPAYEKHFKSPVKAVLFTGVLFAIVHGVVSGAPGHIFLGLVMGALVVMTDSLWTGVLYHITNNAMAMLLAYVATAWSDQLGLGEGALAMIDEEMSPLMMALGGVGYLVVGGVLFILCVGLIWVVNRERMKEDPKLHPRALPAQSGPGGLPYGSPYTAYQDSVATQNEAIRAMQGGGAKFLPYLPVVIAAPIIVMNYTATFLMMLFSGLGIGLPF